MTRDELKAEGYISRFGTANEKAPLWALIEMFWIFIADFKWYGQKRLKECRLNVLGAKAHPGQAYLAGTCYIDRQGEIWEPTTVKGYCAHRRRSDGTVQQRLPEGAEEWPEAVLQDWAWGTSRERHRQIRAVELDPYYYRPYDVRRCILAITFAQYLLDHRQEVDQWIQSRARATDRSKQSEDYASDSAEFIRHFGIDLCGFDENTLINLHWSGRTSTALTYILDAMGGHHGVRHFAMS